MNAAQEFVADGRRYPVGTHVVLMQQPYGAFAKTLLENQNYPDLREFPGGPPKRPYDVTAQTLPLLMGVRAELVREPFEFQGSKVDRVVPPPGAVVGAPGRFGYVISRDTTASSLACNRVLKRGVKALWLKAP